MCAVMLVGFHHLRIMIYIYTYTYIHIYIYLFNLDMGIHHGMSNYSQELD